MTKEFKYLKEALTSDIVQFLMKDYHLDMQTALNTFYESEVYSKISEPSTGLYFQSSRYVYAYLQNELQNGSLS